MSTREDKASPNLNRRLRPRKSISTTTPNPPSTSTVLAESKGAQDRPKRASTSSKPSPSKQDDLATKSETATASLFLCPYCDRKFNARQTASKHARRIHLSTTKQDNFIKCLYCNHSDAESNAIIKHMVDSHPNQYFACLDCHTRFSSTTELAEHKLNACERQKLQYRSKLRQKSSPKIIKNPKKTKIEKSGASTESTPFSEEHSFNGIVISCELKPSENDDAVDIEDKITTNLIMPSAKSLGKSGLDKNAVIVLDDMQLKKRIPPSFSFHNTDADQILFRLGVVHRSPKVGESRKDLIRMMDEPNEKFEKCFDTSFYSKVGKNVQENLSKYVDGTFNFNPNKDSTIKTRKSKAGMMINTAEGFPILLAREQFSRNLFDGFIPRAIAPKHKWKWDTAENDKNLMVLIDQTKRDSHVNSCIITLISGLDIWTQLRMKRKFEEIFKTAPTAKKTEKQNIVSMELKEILESRDIPASSSQVVQCKRKPVDAAAGSELPAYLGLSATSIEYKLQPAVLSGEWVRPRCYVCCACGEQTRDARTLSSHLYTQHPNAQVQHYEIVGETLLSADILKHLYVPPSQMSNRTRPPRGFKDCTKCNKSITLEDLHQHMLDCAGDTPAVRRKCRYRPFGVRRRRPRLPDNMMRKKIRKDIRSRHRQKSHMRPRPRIRTEVGDAETIRKMIADLPAKRNRITQSNVLRPRRTILKAKKQTRLRSAKDSIKKAKQRPVKRLNKPNKTKLDKKQNDSDNSSSVDEDDQPLKLSSSRVTTRSSNGKEASIRKLTINKNKNKKPNLKKKPKMEGSPYTCYHYNLPFDPMNNVHENKPYYHKSLGRHITPQDLVRNKIIKPSVMRAHAYGTQYQTGLTPYYCSNQINNDQMEQSDWGVREVCSRNIREDQLDELQYNQLSLESSDQPIDVMSAGPSHMRQHSSHSSSYNNRQGGTYRSMPGGDSNHNNYNYTAQVPNAPLKHSIASLTSDSEGCDSLASYRHASVSSASSADIVSRSSEIQKEFEKEPMAEKVDKPPLLISTQSYEEQQYPTNSFKEPSTVSPQRHPYDSMAARDFNAPVALFPSESIENRGNTGQIRFPEHSTTLYERVHHLSDDFQQLRQPVAYADTKEPDKSKCNKTRKGLKIENCIAMIRTKKGLPFDKTGHEFGDHKTVESEKINSNGDPKIPTTIKSDPLMTSSATAQKNYETGSNDVTMTFKGHRQGENSKKRSQSISTDKPHLEIDNMKIQKNTLLVHDDKPTSSDTSYNPKQHENKTEINITRPLCLLSTEGTNEPIQGLQTEFSGNTLCRSFEADAGLLNLFWRDIFSKIYSHDGFYHPNAMRHIVKLLTEINLPYLAKNMTQVQYKFVDLKAEYHHMQMLYNYTFSILYKEYRKYLPENTLMTKGIKLQDDAITQKVAALHEKSALPHSVSQSTVNTDKGIEENMPYQEINFLPSTRRTRRKPTKKNTNLDRELQLNNEQFLLVKHTMPQQTGALPIVSFVPAVTPTPETQYLKTPSPPFLSKSIRGRRESYKQASNTKVFENSSDISGTTIHAITPERHAEKIQKHVNMSEVQRLSYEMANAQAKYAGYNVAQAYRLEYENAVMNISQASRENYIKDKQSYEKSNELLFNRYPALTPSPVNQNTDIDGQKSASNNPVNKNSTPDTHENYKSDQEHIAGTNKQSADYLDAKDDYMPNYCQSLDNSYSRQETKVTAQKLCDLPRPPARRSSDMSFACSAQYQNNVPNINLLNNSDRSFDMRSNKNILTNSVYQEPVAPFVPPTVVHRKNMHEPNSALPLCRKPNIEELAPLDLSCDSRKEITLDLTYPTDLTINNLNIQVTKENTCEEVSMTPNIRHSYEIEPSVNLVHHPSLSPKWENPNMVGHKLVLEMPGMSKSPESIEKKQTEITNQNTAFQEIAIAQTDISNTLQSINDSWSLKAVNDEIKNKTVTPSNVNYSLSGQISSPLCNHLETRESEISNTTPIHRQNSLQEKPFENEMIAKPTAQNCVEANYENHLLSKNSTTSLLEKVNTDSQNTDFPHLYTSTFPANVPTAGAYNHNQDSCSTQTTDHHCDQDISSVTDNIQTDQDAETARKIALLPEELVKILGTIPKDHRNQLLDILPQYVSVTLPATTAIQNASQPITKQNTSVINNLNKLSINTAISASSVLPKKRHSPHSQSKEGLNYCEIEATGPFMLKNPQRSTISQDIPLNNVTFYQTNSSNSNKKSESAAVCHGEAITSNSLEKGYVNSDGYNGQPNIYKNEEVSVSFSASPAQLSTAKLNTNQKPSNEQTASLRAVRIKTTSARKSLSDDKVPVKYGFKTIITTEEKSTNLGQAAITAHQENNTPPNLTYENVDLHNKIIHNDFKAALNLRETKYASCFQASNEKSIGDMNEVKFIDNVKYNSRIEKESTSHNTYLDNQSYDTINSSTSATDLLDEKGVDHITEQTAASISLDKIVPHLGDPSSNSTIITPCKEKDIMVSQFQSAPDNSDVIIEMQSKELEKRFNDDVNIANNCSSDIKEFRSLSPNLSNISLDPRAYDSKQDTPSHKVSEKSVPSPIMTRIEIATKASLDLEELQDEDSEDDIVLAVIKEKNNLTSNVSKIVLCDKETVSKQSCVQNKNKKKQMNKSRKRLKRRSNRSETHNHRKSNANSDYSKVLGAKHIDTVYHSLQDMKVDDTLSDKISSSDKANDNSFDANFSVTDFKVTGSSTLKQNYDGDTLIPEHYEIGCLLVKNHLLDNKDINDVSTEDIQVLADTNVSLNLENDKKTDEDDEKIPSNHQKDNCLFNNNRSDFDKDEIAEDFRCDESSKDSISSNSQSYDNSDMNIPLRRSRRGKSMFLDISYSENKKKVEDIAKRTPLTMKRLILSRVEKDKKRVSESSVAEKSTDANDDLNSLSSNETESLAYKKGNLIKRKKSPRLRRMSKKAKSLSELNVKFSNDLIIPSESNILFQNLLKAENKLTDSCNDVKFIVPDTSSDLSVITTRDCIGKDAEVIDNSFIEVKETATSGKRKIKDADVSDITSPKTKKTKADKKRLHPDFDSDDDKVLLKTKQKISLEKCNQDSNYNKFTSHNDIVNEKPTNTNVHKQTANSVIPAETRITCYSRSVSSRRPRSSSAAIKDNATYDPYDIDFIDIIDTEPKMKRKVINFRNSDSTKLAYDKIVVQNEDSKKPISKSSKHIKRKTKSNVKNESDSDSSKSDVPLQKYVEAKAYLEFEINNKTATVSNKDIATIGENAETVNDIVSNDKYLNTLESLNIECIKEKALINKANEKGFPTPSKSFEQTNIDGDSVCEEGTSAEHKIFVNYNIHKQKQKHKKSRNTPPIVDSDSVSKDVNPQLQSDKFMENFGFYSERIPRKSNLLATKKISETFHMISSESDDCFSNYKEKTPRKTTSSENKKKSRTNSDINTSQDRNVTGCRLTNVVIESNTTEIDDEENLIVTEPDDLLPLDDSDLDSLAAHAIMNDVEVQSLENDLFCGLREDSEVKTASYCCVDYQSNIDSVTTKVDERPVLLEKDNEIKEVNKIEEFHETEEVHKFEEVRDIKEVHEIEDIHEIEEIHKTKEVKEVEEVHGIEEVHKIERVHIIEEVREIDKIHKIEGHKIEKVPKIKEAHEIKEVHKIEEVHKFEEDQKIEEDHKIEIDHKTKEKESTELKKKSKKNKQLKQPGVKDKMYPDVEEIDMFEDKFDKIKRKRRSQAVAAKQVQVTVESNTSSRSRKQSERKRKNKRSKKNYQSTHVRTKGALKGFEGIKISIPTQDLNLPTIISPPRQSKKRRKTTVKRKKEQCDSDTSGSEFDRKDISEKDIYEFIDSEDAELFDLRPSTIMERFRSMLNKNKLKHREKDMEKDKLKSRIKDKKGEVKEKGRKKVNDTEKELKKIFSSDEGHKEKYVEKKINRAKKNSHKDSSRHANYPLAVPTDKDSYTKFQKDVVLNASQNPEGDKKSDGAVAGTSGFMPVKKDESDYESEMSVPEGDFIFYTPNDKLLINCACPNGNDSDDSDIGRGCGRLNCVNKNRNAGKKAAIGNIFKNNAVRCEKPEMKEPEPQNPDEPKPNLDQLFDSLLETETKPNNSNIMAENRDNDLAPEQLPGIKLRRNFSPSATAVELLNLAEFNKGECSSASNDDIICIFDEDQTITTNRKNECTHNKIDEVISNKSQHASQDSLSDSDSIQIYTFNKPKENIGYSLMSEECTQVNLADIIADKNDEAIDTDKRMCENDKHAKYNSEDEFDINKPESLNRQYMHLILPAEKASACAQTDNDYDEETGNESTATKYLLSVSTSKASNDMYAIVPSQSSHTDKSNRSDSDSSKDDDTQSKLEDKSDTRDDMHSRTRSRKYGVRKTSHKYKSSKSVKTKKDKTGKSFEDQPECDDDDIIEKRRGRASRKSDRGKSNVKSNSDEESVYNEDSIVTPQEDLDALTAPSTSFAAEKHSPRKSDEGISTSHDHSADAFEQSLIDSTGVAYQRARRKCTVGKQNVLAEHWSSESESDNDPARPNSADSTAVSSPRRKKSRKREGHHANGRKGRRHSSKSDGKRGSRRRRGAPSDDSDGDEGSSTSRAHPRPKIRARAAHHYWSSESEDAAGSQPQHGWIVGNSHKKLVTMLAHAKGRKRTYAEKYLD